MKPLFIRLTNSDGSEKFANFQNVLHYHKVKATREKDSYVEIVFVDGSIMKSIDGLEYIHERLDPEFVSETVVSDDAIA
ncbi:MAG TPA: hypothetical protein VK666_11160 [Chryseolinea sp.]|nr:hypothetical protein [Chryseolinea sp.]